MKNFKRLLPISVMLAGAVFADQPGQTPQPISETNLQGMAQPISVNHGTDIGFYFDGSYLYWKAEADIPAFASNTDFDTNGNSYNVKARNSQLDFEWNSGGQFEIGYIFDQRQGWKAGLSGTHFEGHAHGSKHVSNFDPGTNFLLPTWYAPFAGGSISKASAHWELDYNTVDLTLGRDFYVSKWISFSPYFGLQGAWLEQEYRVKYEGGSRYLPASTFVAHETHLHFDHHFKGFGFEFGTGFIFHIVKNFGIIGNIQGSMLWGYINTLQKSNGAIPNYDGSSIITTPEKTHVSEKKHRLRTNIATELGFIWEMFWNENKNRFHLSAMYAFNIWFNQQEFNNIGFSANQIESTNLTLTNYATIQSSPGDLQLQGLVIKAGFDF